MKVLCPHCKATSEVTPPTAMIICKGCYNWIMAPFKKVATANIFNLSETKPEEDQAIICFYYIGDDANYTMLYYVDGFMEEFDGDVYWMPFPELEDLKGDN